MFSLKAHELVLTFCLLSTICANRPPNPRCTTSPCPSPSSPLLPVTELPSFTIRLPVRQSAVASGQGVNSGSTKPNKDEFFEQFFNVFERLKQIFRKSQTSKAFSRTNQPGPTPGIQTPITQDEFHLRVKNLTDGIMSLFLNDVLGQRGVLPVVVVATMHPYTAASSTGSQQGRLRRLFFNFTVQGMQENANFLEKFLASPKLDAGNSSAVKMFVRSNIPKIAVGYWKLMSWFLTKLQSLSCGQDCSYIERMVQFCKDQHRMCQKAEINSTGTPTVGSADFSIKPTPLPGIGSGSYCSPGSRNCPFKSDCVPNNVPCMNNRDIFNVVALISSRIALKPTESIKQVPQPASQAQSVPSSRGSYNRTMMEYAWMQASMQMPQLKIGDLAKTYDTFYNYLRMDSNNQQETGQSNEICSRICEKRNTTYCWAEMRCKQKGAKCSLKHLKEMMNRTSFENQSSCEGSFFCPVLQNCTSSEKSCDASRFMQLPCDAKCMNATTGKGRKASSEEIQIFRLKCMDNEKYCPRSLGCVGSNESCSGNSKLNVPLGDGPEDERRAFCRMREYICPRVYGTWKKMRCDESRLSGSVIQPTERLPTFARSLSSQSMKSKQTPAHTIKPKPTHAMLSSKRFVHSTVIQPPMPTFSLPNFTLISSRILQSQITLPGRVMYLALAKFACPSSVEFYMIASGGSETKLAIPDSGSGNGMLLPLQIYLKYVSTRPSFHGLCLLKYTVFTPSPGARYSPRDIVPIATGTAAGTLAVVIFPSFGEINAKMTGKSFIDIKEDEVNPPCVKLRDMIQFNITSVQIASGIRPEFERFIDSQILNDYKSKLSYLRDRKVEAAVIGSTGVTFRSGIWRQKYGESTPTDFPRHFNVKNPLILNMNTCIAFYPAKDFNGKVSLTIVGALKVYENGRQRIILGKRELVIGVNILSEPDPPVLTTEDSCLPPYSYDFQEAQNTGFTIESLLTTGKTNCGGANRYYPLVENIAALKESRIGLTIIGASTCNFGHWEYKDDGAFTRVDITGGQGLCLFKSARIRFVPANYTTLWSTRVAKECIWIKAKAWISLTSNVTGHCNVTGNANDLISRDEVQLSAVRRGCDDVVGSMRKPDACGRCGRKRLSNIQCPCDGVPGSGAVTDECNYCTGGTTGIVYHKKDCSGRCYANGTESENIVDSCGRCQNRRFLSNDARDCAGDCTFGRNRACINRCGICVGGRTRKALNSGINACGNCIANSSVPCSKSLSLSKVIEVSRNQQFMLKITARGYSSLGRLACSLQMTGGSSSAINLGMAFAQRQSTNAIINSNMCAVQEAGDYEIKLRAVIGTGGNYRLSCRVDQESNTTTVNRGEVKVMNEQSTVDRIVPSIINSCRNGSFILLGNGFKNSTDVACAAACEKRCDFKTRGRFINSTAFACSIEVDGSNNDCKAQDVNLHALASAAAEPPAFSKSLAMVRVQCVYPRALSLKFNSLRRELVIQLDKPASLAIRGRPSCSSFFESDTIRLLGKSTCYLSNDKIIIRLDFGANLMSSVVGSKIALTISRRNLRCQGEDGFSVIQGGFVQNLNVSLPSSNLVPEIRGDSSLGTCDDIRLDGGTSSDGMGGRINFNWGLYKDSTLVQSGGRRSWFKLSGTGLTPNGNYSVKLCVSSNYGLSKCKQSQLTVVDNSNNTLIVKINGAKHRKLKAKGRYKFRPLAKLNLCGKKAAKASKMFFTWQVKDIAGYILLTSEGRNLDIKKGALAPGKNYTIQCSVRVRLNSDKDVIGDTEITVEVEGSPVEAKIRGGREMTIGCNETAIFDARPSIDPDNTDEPSYYFWSCNEKDGLPCFNKSNPVQRLSFAEKARVELNVGKILECQKSYVFTMVYRKGLRQSNTSISVTVQPGEPAEVKLDQQQIRNRIILKGYVKTASSANVTWSCIKQDGFGFIDLSNINVAMEVLSGPVLVRGGRRVVRPKVLILKTDFLQQGVQYLINLEVTNADGKSNAKILVTTPSPPVPGDVIIDPPYGMALNTSFVISAGNGWTGEIANYDIGYEIEGEKGPEIARIKSYSSDPFIDGVQLPPGPKKNNHTLKIFITARNSDGSETTSTKTIQVRESQEISEQEVAYQLSRSSQAVNESNIELAVGLIRVLSETQEVFKINITNGLSVKEQSTSQMITVMEKKTDSDLDKEIFAALVSITRKRVNGTDLQGGLMERLAKKLSESYLGVAPASSPVGSKRKRRNVENSPSQEAFTPKSKEEVDSTMAIFDNLIEEKEPGNLQDNLKMNFTNTIPLLVRSLCANTFTANDYLLSKSNLSTIRSNRLPGYTFDTNNVNISDASNGSFIRLGSYFKEKYESWNCSNSGLLCTEVCVGTVLYHHHMFQGEFEGRISDIASVMLIHPETHGVENAGVMTTPLTYTMMLKEVPDSQHTVECRVWNSAASNWTKDGCNTSYSGGPNAVCHCLVLGNVTVFKVPMPVVTTLFPPATTATGNPSTDQQTSHSSSPVSESTLAPTKSTTRTTAKSSTSQSAIEVSFSFPVNYNDFASKASDLKNAITDMLSRKLNISKSRIVNLDIRPGSIIVTFTLLNNDGYSNEKNVDDLQTQLTTLASNGSLSLVFDGVTLTADPASLKISAPKPTTHLPPLEKKPEKSDTVVIIVSVCVAAVIILVIIIVVWYVRFRKKRSKTIGNNMYGENLHGRSLGSNEYISLDDPRDIDSSEPVKQPLNDSAGISVQGMTTFSGKQSYVNEALESDNGGVVSVGIGSTTSIKA